MILKLHKAPILIEEVQYAPELFSYIKIAIDRGAEPGSFWLIGSQSYKMMKLAQESLAGRIAILNLTSLSQHEIHSSGESTPFTLSLEQLKQREQLQEKADVVAIFERIWKGSHLVL